ncbi:mammalian ependymin-related protein 1-like [Lingula anatina]|uniref:Mammalian ependymin-related protein 1-like n=2 Tax=Lingula anatina TaxID=7574 RepID=A0A1S3HLJ0_LINAN|nr:mammalian ependymin-related protein 1-like [Lingula anatina]|eukprot:XP_013386331.1 mammalian ependymin-related protein 1-like [Lingula anatina]
MKPLVLALVLLVGIAHSQIPKPCFTPARWEAKASRFDHNHGKMEHYRFVYDAVMQRKVIFDNILLHPGRKRYEYLILNDVNVMYRIDRQSKKCEKMFPGPWRPYGIPPMATFKTEYEIGYPGEDFTAQEWIFKEKDSDAVLWRGVYGLKYCFPVVETFFNPNNRSESNTINFYDIASGIPDPTVFLPPSECRDAVLVHEKPPAYF